MEPNSFEKDFRDKLNERKIEPSNKAWDRLDAMLSVAEENKPITINSNKKSKRKWLYIAASFIGFLLVGTLFFNQNKNAVEVPKTVVVEKEIQKESVTKPAINNIDSIKTENAIAEKTSEQVSAKQEKLNNQISNKTNKNESNQIAESSIIIKNNQEKQSASNQVLITENAKNSNVDQLLETAENKVLAESSTKKAKVKINASDLLNQVDGELELSFREKMITKVNKNFQDVKVALSNRNQKE
ncbi:hypothetical protein [Flavobacterium sp. S87F.05.LMB.W.Kidney.N]|uniref:hypothetical protein n=1 Tax=Flavobacterium sp. S87F.05.LMB.W.Kidney.N TaxID=1278758 RepID=UPI001065F77A|nr:hypothetical protein [Flavobacterium sp. S87F.05.LMB.W.Kidney.N]TDX14238.1 hypothetical protein EDB96_0968 [Flavobacterium sp. S87F.05.LMB.W.Kidney.N]